MARPIALAMILGLLTADAPGARPAPATADESLETVFRALLKKEPGASVAIAYKDLKSGEEVLIAPDERFHAASTMKVPVMMEVYRQAEDGRLSLDDKVTLKNEFASIVDGSPYALKPIDDSELTLYKHLGEARSVRELVVLMITESSNLATNILVDRVGAAKATAFANRLGADGVKVLRGVEDSKAYSKGMNNEVTARGLMTLFARLAEGKVVSEKASAEMMGVLRRQKFDEGIPAGVPAGIAVAHKTGWFTGTYHDAGVVAPPGREPFVLVVLTRGIASEKNAHRLVAELARAAYRHAGAP